MNLIETGKILTIDDEAYIRESIRTFLEDYGFEVLEAENGRIGLEIFDQEKPDLVILDLRMPEIDGLQVLDLLKTKSPETPIIIASGTGNISSVVEALHLGAWDYILKPIQDMNVLYHGVTKCLKESRLQRENLEYQEHLEELVKARTRELKESEERYRAIFEYAGTAMVILNWDKRITMANSQFADLAGFSLGEILEIKKWTDFVVPDELERLDTYHTLRRDSARCNTIPSQYEFRFIGKNGEIRHVLATVGMIPDSSKSVASLLDITERYRAEDREQSLEKQLHQSQKMEAIGTLAGGIAHDLNNILSPVLGYADMIIRSSNRNSKTFQRSEKIRKAAFRAADLVRQILSFSRMEEEDVKPIKIHPVVKEVVKLLKGTIPSTISIVDRVETDCGYVEVDPTQIHQILMNLCTNAFHAMENSGGELRVSLKKMPKNLIDSLLNPKQGEQKKSLGSNIDFRLKSGSQDNLKSANWLCLEITDTGEGMSQEVQEKIFDPYFTTKAEGKGTGLGLATVYSIVKNCQGDIIVKSLPGKGTSFTVLLPVVAMDISQNNRLFSGDIQEDGSGERLMIVDDDQDIADMCKEGLEFLKYRVEVFYSSRDALEYFRLNADRVDLVITDQTMPWKTGFELAEEMMAIRKNIPVILCSGYTDGIDAVIAAEAGIKRFIMKPVTVEDLSREIQQIFYATDCLPMEE